LPDGLTSLTTLSLDGNPLQSLVLPESLAIGALAATIDALVSQGVSVSIYLPGLTLTAITRAEGGNFDYLLTGPPGNYSIQVTEDFSTWTDLAPVTIPRDGSIRVTDSQAKSRPHSFYRAVRAN